MLPSHVGRKGWLDMAHSSTISYQGSIVEEAGKVGQENAPNLPRLTPRVSSRLSSFVGSSRTITCTTAKMGACRQLRCLGTTCQARRPAGHSL